MKPIAEERKGPNKWLVAVLVLGGLFFISIIIAAMLLISVPESETSTGNVARILITGAIVSERQDTLFAEREVSASSDIVKLIKEATKNPGIKAIVLEIDSPGGAPVASDEIVRAIKQAKQNKTTVAWIRETGASGAYWVASSTDYVIAHPLSVTGSIGVNAAYLEFSGLMQKYGVKYNRITGGQYKDIGSPFSELTAEEKKILQTKIDFLHDYFIRDVAANRKLAYDTAKSIGNGLFYFGAEAKELGLVDELGGEVEVREYLEKKLGTKVVFAEYKVKRSLLDMLSELAAGQSYQLGRGIGSTMLQQQDEKIMLE